MADGMSATTYYVGSTDEQLSSAQHTLDTHVTSSADGRCLVCATPGPCWRREAAVSIFSRTLPLPRRQPGATHPEAIGRRASAGSWFGGR
jgi:hypothetical protein